MNLSQLLAVLRARWLVATSVFVIAIVVALAMSLLLPPRYQATSSVLIDIRPDPLSGVLMPERAVPQMVTTQVDVLKSPRVAQRVVRNLNLAAGPQIESQWREATKGVGSVEQWLVETLQRGLTVTPSPESSVILITYEAPDPRFAAAVANAFAQAYLDTTVELRVDPAKRFAGFFDGQMKEARERLEQAQSRLSAFQREKGIIATDERLDVENARLNELSSQVVMLQSLAAEASGRQAQAAGASADRLQEVLTNPLLNQLKAELSRGEAKVQELTTRLGDNNPQVIEARASVAEVRSRLESETRKVSSGANVTSSIASQREARVRVELENQRAKVLRMKQVRDEGSVLAREVDSASKVFDALQARLGQTALESQNVQGGAYRLTEAVPPVEPSFPKIPLNVGIAAFLGLMLAAGAALLLEMLDRRVRGVADVVQGMGLPVLAVIPKPSSKRVLERRALAVQQQMVGQLAGPVKGT